ncbi:MAG: hydroxyethylthiazole kinase [Pseudolabrys sp.]|nr:hydroxyethylthiazole kinase [Pseudolabrys sp.]
MQHPRTASDDVAQGAAALVARLAARKPRVHCITNAVAQNFTANALLAAGCVPSMTLSPEEIGAFIAQADALLVNLGTFDAERREAARAAVAAATERAVPWVLDPVFIDRSALRTEFARALLLRGPAVVRLNHAEFAALAGAPPTAETARERARRHKTVIALSGEVDIVTDGARTAQIANGHALMGRITAMGCAGSALVAAALAVETDAWLAAAAALAVLGIAGEIAGETAQGPGSFAAAFLDALYRLDAATVAARAKVT